MNKTHIPGRPYETPETELIQFTVEENILDSSYDSNTVPGLDRPDLGDIWS